MGMSEQVFDGWMSFLTKPARIREETLDLASSSAAIEIRLCTSLLKSKEQNFVKNFVDSQALETIGLYQLMAEPVQ